MSTANPSIDEKKSPPSAAKIIIASCIGNALEWYDISLYSYMAVYIGKAFFPNSDPTVSLLLALGTFALSFLIRPIGALILGAYADAKGRKPALLVTLTMMMVGTLLLVVTPSYAAIGVFAPILVLIARLIQGFSAGGEFGSATTLMLEHLPSRKGFAASFQFTSQGISTILAAVVGAILTATLSADQITSWGFRVAFLLGALVGPIGLYIRKHVPESPEFENKVVKEIVEVTGKRRSIWAPARDLLSKHLAILLLLIFTSGLGSSLTYMVTYVPTYSINTLGLSPHVGFVSVIFAGIFQILFYPVSGWLSDRFGHARQMLPGAILVALAVYPIFALVVAHPGLGMLILVLAVLVFFKAWYSAPSAALQAKIFPVEARGIGLAFSYNCGVAIFGGLTPFVTTLLISGTHDGKAPAYWLMMTSVLAIAALIVIRMRYKQR